MLVESFPIICVSLDPILSTCRLRESLATHSIIMMQFAFWTFSHETSAIITCDEDCEFIILAEYITQL